MTQCMCGCSIMIKKLYSSQKGLIKTHQEHEHFVCITLLYQCIVFVRITLSVSLGFINVLMLLSRNALRPFQW